MKNNKEIEVGEPWQYKMDVLVKNVMGKEYEVDVEGDNIFYILYNGMQVLRRETANELKSHWRQEITECLKFLFENKIKHALKKL